MTETETETEMEMETGVHRIEKNAASSGGIHLGMISAAVVMVTMMRLAKILDCGCCDGQHHWYCYHGRKREEGLCRWAWWWYRMKRI